MADISAQLKQVVELRGTLDREQAGDLMRLLLSGEVSDVQVGALLAAMATRGETAAEIAGFVDTMRAAAVDIPLTEEERATLVDTCGTGGNARGTFNISTAVALVAAAAGFPSGMRIAKHGNRGVTSKCGSADVLKAMGVPVELSPAQAVQCLRQTGFLFLYAPALHPAMRAVQHVRKALGIRTIFNILGPLTNPAGARAQVLGVYSAHLVPLVAEALAMLGVRHAMVVHGHNDLGSRDEGAGSSGRRAEVQATAGQQVPGCLDELTLTGPSEVAEVRGHTVALRRITPEDVGLQRAPFAALAGGDAATNAAILESIFAGEQGPRRDVVLFNAAAALVVGGAEEDLVAGIRLAADAIDSGAVTTLVERLRDFAKEA
ncbi:MAG: anthranilate phosphoribosyltransferase [Acidobacteriaceae bacterium]